MAKTQRPVMTHFPFEIDDAVRAMAQREGISLSAMVRDLVLSALKQRRKCPDFKPVASVGRPLGYSPGPRKSQLEQDHIDLSDDTAAEDKAA